MRSRFWMARDLEAMSGGVGIMPFFLDNKWFKKKILPPHAPKELALHCATEYSQLASFLPELYELYGSNKHK